MYESPCMYTRASPHYCVYRSRLKLAIVAMYGKASFALSTKLSTRKYEISPCVKYRHAFIYGSLNIHYFFPLSTKHASSILLK